MSNFGDHPTGFFDSSRAYYNTVATTSLRFVSASSHHLHRTPSGNSSDTDKKKYTFSTWVKRTKLGTTQQILAIGSGAGGAPWFFLYFTDADKIQAYWYSTTSGNATNSAPTFAPILRDTSAWYNIVLVVDTTDGTATDRFKLYINGVRAGVASAGNALLQNFIGVINSTSKHWIGRNNNDEQYLDAYLAETIMVDGTAVGETSGYLDEFGELKNGVWIPKAFGGSYGTNGFRLKYTSQAHDATASEGSADTDNVAADSSGSNHHWIAGDSTSTDDCAMPDSPENNFATLLGGGIAESADYQSYVGGGTYTEGNLKLTGTSDWSNGKSNFEVPSGKWYVEYRVTALHAVTHNRFGVFARPARTYDEYFWLPNGTAQIDGTARNDRVGTYGVGDILQVALDLENNNIFFGKDNTWENSATASEIVAGTATNAFASGSEVPTGDRHNYGFYNNPHTSSAGIYNFGQDSSFAGTETAQTNTDSEGFGQFQYEPPSGFLALCSANLPEPTIGPNSATQANDNFNTVIYTGNGGTLSVAGFGHQPDWLWVKSRNIAGNHRWTDSTRGVTNNIISNASDAEKGGSDAEDIDSFDSDGFTVTQAEYDDFNDGSDSYVAWSWKANGGTTSNNSDGDGASVVQANTTAGFSIVTYTGSSNETYGHGLSQAPEMIIVKGRNVAHNWAVYHQDVQNGTANGFLELNSTGALQTGSNPRFLNGTTSTSQPTSTVFNVNHYSGSTTNASNNSDTYIAYCFHSVEGYSKFGFYTGNANADGTFVYLGFRPRWVMVKKTNGAATWWIIDAVRDAVNVTAKYLMADVNNVESNGTDYTSFDFLSNGFKIRNTSTAFNSGTHIYMAFAEAPFKYANAR